MTHDFLWLSEPQNRIAFALGAYAGAFFGIYGAIVPVALFLIMVCSWILAEVTQLTLPDDEVAMVVIAEFFWPMILNSIVSAAAVFGFSRLLVVMIR